MTIKNGDTPAMAAIGQISNTNEVWSFQVADNNTFQFTGLTKREMFCLHMGVVDTGDAELGAIIHKGNRQKIAMHMMAASQSKDGKPDFHYEAIMSAKAVDALLEELERTSCQPHA